MEYRETDRQDDAFEPELEPIVPESLAYDFNPDPEWQAHAPSYERMIQKIATKYCSVDDSLREDVMQEARIAVATLRPENADGFEHYHRGELTEAQWQKSLQRYVHNAIRNSILSCLDSYPKGNWYIGRTRHVKDKRTGQTRKVYLPPRYSSLDFLIDDHGMQVDEHGNISWPNPSDDGLAFDSTLGDTISKNWGTRKWWTRLPEDLDNFEAQHGPSVEVDRG